MSWRNIEVMVTVIGMLSMLKVEPNVFVLPQTFPNYTSKFKQEIEAPTSVKMMAFHDSRNYQDAVVVASSLVEQINREDVNNMVQVQRDM